jgi:hypothetical protein
VNVREERVCGAALQQMMVSLFLVVSLLIRLSLSFSFVSLSLALNKGEPGPWVMMGKRER